MESLLPASRDLAALCVAASRVALLDDVLKPAAAKLHGVSTEDADHHENHEYRHRPKEDLPTPSAQTLATSQPPNGDAGVPECRVLLLGPPAESLRAAAASAAAVAAKAAAAIPTTGDAFLDLMDAEFNKPTPKPTPAPKKARTENASPTFVSSGDPCLDFFFHVVPGTPAASVASLLADAWAAEPNTALRLACNLRGVRGTGKSDREGFYASALWMHGCHPTTLAHNAGPVAEFGYLKDLPEMLHRIIHGGVSTRTPGKKAQRRPRRKGNAPRGAETREARIAAANERDRKLSADAAVEHRKRRAEPRQEPSTGTPVTPSTGSCTYDCTADLFAKLLAEDLKKLADGKLSDISLAAKWCPSLDSCYDRSTLLCEAIARRLFPKGSAPDLPEDLEDAYYAYRERFESYLADVKSGKAKIAAGALLPHEILVSIDSDGVADLQWERMVTDLWALGKLNNCIAVCDVSGSMDGLPMDVCVSLGLLVTELSSEPWHHRVITFSSRPQLHQIPDGTLMEKTNFIRRMEWNMNTDFQAVFDKLLHIVVAGKLTPEQMVKRVFVFSDMEFDIASSRPWETDYEAITRKFTEAGYGAVVPEVVFWNLRDSDSVPVTALQKGVALVSGFSKNMVKLFLDGDGIVTPRDIMDKAISGPEYQKLVVFD
ncbi:unnamed protein product [Miscanthus lutarioriparius]|uniref:Uncharacterized protein n=1 Tax=Miscanthus lutarioriparius TaxID=422564 RepID=A0A811SE63_9POAL|nr:unnamed protein product [Miscanthus lutarioriparius]